MDTPDVSMEDGAVDGGLGTWTLVRGLAPTYLNGPGIGEDTETVLELDRPGSGRVAFTFPSTLLPALRRLLGRTGG